MLILGILDLKKEILPSRYFKFKDLHQYGSEKTLGSSIKLLYYYPL